MRNKNQNVYTVGQVNSYIKNIFDQDYMLRRIYVSGEVSNCKYHPSGHIYFSLKDAEGTISCVMFAGSRRGLAFPMRDGDNVIVGGSISVYERDGKYQIYAKAINIEAKTMIDITTKQIIPAVIRYTTVLADSINAVQAVGAIDVSVQLDLLKKCSALLKSTNSAMIKVAITHEPCGIRK